MMKFFRSGPKMFGLAMILLAPSFFLLCPEVACSEEPVEDALAKEDELNDELKYLKEETYVITPSKIPQRIEKAPGTIHVVTDKEIRQIGARYLWEVVQTVPGWSVWAQYWGYSVFYVRGRSGALSSEILFMMNSHVVNNVVTGNALDAYGNLDLDNVKRIEFVSGPASALYGSGAMAGVINIITKEGDDVDGLQVTGSGGSFNTWEGSALFGKTINGYEVAAYANYRNSDGFQGFVDDDQQSVLDRQYGTHASLAPGNMKGDNYEWDAQLTAKYGDFKFDGKYIEKKRDLPFGNRPILDNMSEFHNKNYYLNLSYDVSPTEGLNLMAKAYRNQETHDMVAQYFPKGSLMITPAGPRLTSENRFTQGGYRDSRTGGEAQATYEIVDYNTIVAGITYERQEVYNTYREGNIIPTSNPYIYIPPSSFQNFSEEYIMQPEERNVYAAYLEDIWDILENLRLTIGGRYDYYTQSGGQFSPRLGINWEITERYNTKFLYGRAFRAPYFFELYSPEYGNPDLKNETIDSYELSFGTNFSPFTGQITLFRNEIKEAITADPIIYRYMNGETAIWVGADIDMKYDFGRGTYVEANYTQLTADYENEDVVAYMVPQRYGTLTGNIRLNRYLNFNAQFLYRGNWSRANNDPREDPGDYVIANTTLIAKNFLEQLKGLEVRGSVYNLFNKHYTSPTGPGQLPGDMPMPGINFMLELRYTF